MNNRSIVLILVNKETAEQTMARLHNHMKFNSAVLACIAAGVLMMLCGFDIAWAFHGPETDDSLLYMTTIKSRAQVHNTAAIQLHNRPFPLTSPIILFSREDIQKNQLPFPYPGSITDLDSFLRKWMMTYHLSCVAAGDATAPISYMVSDFKGLERMANVALYPTRLQSKEQQNHEKGTYITVVEHSSATSGTRIVQRLSALEVRFFDMRGEPQLLYVGDETLAVCFQKYFPVQDMYADEDEHWSPIDSTGDFTIS